MYIKLKNGAIDKYPYSLNELIRDNPNTSFPAEISDECASEFDVYPVTQVEYPQVDHTKNVIETAELVGGKWTQKFSVVDASDDEIAQRKQELNDNAKRQRAMAYREESDPLFFKWQRGEATEQEWLDKVNEIKQRYQDIP